MQASKPESAPVKKTARCACGAASITVQGKPEMHGVCHCGNCKRRTGSAFGISSYYPKAQVLEQCGPTTVYAFHHTIQKHDQERHFCSRCGTTLFWYVSSMPELIGIAGGCFAADGIDAPDYSVNHAQKEQWLTLGGHCKISE